MAKETVLWTVDGSDFAGCAADGGLLPQLCIEMTLIRTAVRHSSGKAETRVLVVLVQVT